MKMTRTALAIALLAATSLLFTGAAFARSAPGQDTGQGVAQLPSAARSATPTPRREPVKPVRTAEPAEIEGENEAPDATETDENEAPEVDETHSPTGSPGGPA